MNHTLYTNHAEINTAELGRITFFEIMNSEREKIVTLAMPMDMLEALGKAIEASVKQYKEAVK